MKKRRKMDKELLAELEGWEYDHSYHVRVEDEILKALNAMRLFISKRNGLNMNLAYSIKEGKKYSTILGGTDHNGFPCVEIPTFGIWKYQVSDGCYKSTEYASIAKDPDIGSSGIVSERELSGKHALTRLLMRGNTIKFFLGESNARKNSSEWTNRTAKVGKKSIVNFVWNSVIT